MTRQPKNFEKRTECIMYPKAKGVVATWASVIALCLVPASLTAPAVARETPNPKTLSVRGTANPFLAGQSPGTKCCSGDSLPAERPLFVGWVTPGTTVTFSNTSGGVSYQGGTPTDGPAGNLGFKISASNPPANGIANYKNAPVDALVGVFLPALGVSTEASPATTGLDFNTPTTTPGLQQIFYIGNVGSSGLSITVPAGAGTLWLGTVDGEGWYNNSGAIKVTVSGLACPPPGQGRCRPG